MTLEERERLRQARVAGFRVDVDHFTTGALSRLQKVCEHGVAVAADDGELEPLFFLKRGYCLLQIKVYEDEPDGGKILGRWAFLPPQCWA